MSNLKKYLNDLLVFFSKYSSITLYIEKSTVSSSNDQTTLSLVNSNLCLMHLLLHLQQFLFLLSVFYLHLLHSFLKVQT